MDKILEKLKLNGKKGTENIVIFLVLVVIVMIVINALFKPNTLTSKTSSEVIINETKSDDDFEKKLEKILSSIDGAGKVKVMVSYENTIEKVPLMDTKETITITEEADKNGGERKTKETNNEYKIAYEESGSKKTAIIKQSTMPSIVGVIVTAEGASSSKVKEDIIEAVSAVTSLGANRIKVFQSN